MEAELRAAEAEVYDVDSGLTIRVSAQKIVLRFEMEGLEVAPGARHHDDLRSAGPTRKTVEKSEFRAGGSISGAATGRLGLDGATVNAEAALKADAALSASKTVEAFAETFDRYIIARPGDRWEIMEGDGRPLNATYLTSDTPLCLVRSLKGANRLGVTATAEVMERDLKIDLVSAKSLIDKVSTNKRKMIEILIAKTIDTSIGAKYNGKLTVSRVETDFED